MFFRHHAFEPAPVIGWPLINDRCGGGQICRSAEKPHRHPYFSETKARFVKLRFDSKNFSVKNLAILISF